MKSFFYFYLVILFITSCKRKENNKNPIITSPIIKRIEIEDSTEAGTGYYFYIENYNDIYYKDFFLVERAEKFINSLEEGSRVGSIYFGSSMKLFNLKNTEIYYKRFKEYDGVNFLYNGKVNKNGYHEIEHITVYIEGKELGLNFNQ